MAYKSKKHNVLQEESAMTYCTQCGKPLQQDDANFCTACGARLTPAPADAPPPPAYEPPTDAPPPPAYEPPVDVPPRPAYVPPADTPPRLAYVPPANTPPPPAPPAPLSSDRATFRNTGLGLIFPSLLLIAALVFGMVINHNFNWSDILWQWAVHAAIAFAAVLPVRAKGPDLSIAGIIGLSSVIISLVIREGEEWYIGVLIAVLVAAVIGAVNGVINGVIRDRSIPLTVLISAAVTGVVIFILRNVAIVLTDGAIIRVDIPVIPPEAAAFVLVLISFILAFFLNLGTKLGSPVYKTDRSVGLCIVAYMVSAVIAALAGFYYAIYGKAGIQSLGSGYEIFVLFVFACVISSRALDNRFAPVLYALLPALSWYMLIYVLILIGVYYQTIAECIVVLIALLIAFCSRYEKKPRANSPKS